MAIAATVVGSEELSMLSSGVLVESSFVVVPYFGDIEAK
jgi:hypothetical protein